MRGRVAIDLIDRKFGRLTVIRRAEPVKGQAKWLCQCTCGGEATVFSSNLRRGISRSCGCLNREKAKEAMTFLRSSINAKTEAQLVGKTFNRLTVVSLHGTELNGCKQWVTTCCCGREVLVRTNALISGRTKSCGCWRADSRKKEKGLCMRNHLLATYKAAAKRRGYEWGLTEEEFFTMVQQPCHYCGEPPQERNNSKKYNGGFICNGVDRKDNTQGYMLQNALPCCSPCNRAKSVMTYDEYRAFIIRAGKFQLQLSMVE